MSSASAADAKVPTGNVLGEVDAAEIFTKTGGLVATNGELTDHGKIVKRAIGRAKAQPYLVASTAILGAMVVVMLLVMIFKKK